MKAIKKIKLLMIIIIMKTIMKKIALTTYQITKKSLKIIRKQKKIIITLIIFLKIVQS